MRAYCVRRSVAVIYVRVRALDLPDLGTEVGDDLCTRRGEGDEEARGCGSRRLGAVAEIANCPRDGVVSRRGCIQEVSCAARGVRSETRLAVDDDIAFFPLEVPQDGVDAVCRIGHYHELVGRRAHELRDASPSERRLTLDTHATKHARAHRASCCMPMYVRR